MFSNQEQYFVDGENISGTYNINGVSNISSSGIGNTDISGNLKYLIIGSKSENSFEKVPLFNNNKNYPNNWVFNYDINSNSFFKKYFLSNTKK